MRLRIRFLLLTTTFLLLVGACRAREPSEPPLTVTSPTPTSLSITATPQAEKQATERQITVLTRDPIDTLDPYLMTRVNPEDSVAAHLWDTLVWLDDDLEPQPRLAESWRLVNDLTWELYLRQDVTFHNGEPFDAQAVKYSLERTAQLENSTETFASDVTLQSVEIIDDYAVRIHTTEPAVALIYELSSVEMLPPVHYSQNSLADLSRNPVGSGPYRLVGWEPGVRLVLEANLDYWQGTPLVLTLTFQSESDDEKRLTQLTQGQVDLVSDLTPDQAAAADTESTALLMVESTRRLFVGLRLQGDTPLSDRRIRQALNYAIDVQTLIDQFHNGYGQPFSSWVSAPQAAADSAPWPYDPDQARELMAQAGYPDGFETTMDTPSGRYHRDQEIAQEIAAQLAGVGITVTVQSHDWTTYVRDRLIPKQTAPLFLLSLSSRGNALEDTRNLAYSFPFNPTLWYNEKFEELLDKAEQDFNQTLRANVLRQAQTIAYEEAPWIWLWRPYLFYGVSDELQEWWQPRADGLLHFYTPAAAETPAATETTE